MALWVDDEQDRFFPGPIGRNLRTSPHHIARWVRCSAPRLPEQPVPPPIRLRQSCNNNRSRDRPSHHRRGSRLHSLQETWSLEDNRTPCPHVRENQLVRGKKIQADHHLLDSTIRSKFSLPQSNASAIILIQGNNVTDNATKIFTLHLEKRLEAPGALNSLENVTTSYTIARIAF